MTDPGSFPIEWLSVLLYAETHYRFRYFLSFLKKQEPEVIADAPFRIEPGGKIPILLLVKDGDKFPATLLRAKATLRGKGLERVVNLFDKPVLINKKWWWKIFAIEPGEFRGWAAIDIEFDLAGRNGRRTYHNDNHRTSTHDPLRVFVADNPLPRLKHFHFGELHSHSQYTDDQVEFGAPLEASLILSRASGLSFFAVTDHSYDLDDRVDDYLRNDPDLPKWNSLQREVDALNRKHTGFSILRGEEASCRSHSGHNVHMLLLGGTEFVSGSGDSAERWLQTRSEHGIWEILGAKDPGVLAFAAHPAEDVPFLQRVLLHRGTWGEEDVLLDGLTGVQFANGSRTGFQRGREQWVSLLLKGKRSIVVAGNDAHGNFNRFRQIRIPFVSIGESNEHRFGEMRTAVLLKSRVTERAVLHAIRSGNCVITNGPIAAFAIRTHAGKWSGMGSSVRGTEFELSLEARSTPEFGVLQRMTVWKGNIGRAKEERLLDVNTTDYSVSRRLMIKTKQPCYIRLEVASSTANEFDQTPHFCLSNPIWINQP